MTALLAALLAGAVVVALGAGPLLARTGVRIAAGYRTPDAGAAPRDPGAVRVVSVTAVLAALLVGAVLLLGARPFLLALAWAAGAGVVLAQVDLAVHRLPDRVVLPSVAVVAAAALLDALVLGSWDSLLRALLAGGGAFAVAAVVGLVSPRVSGSAT